MPVTDELGRLIRQRLPGLKSLADSPATSFEDWLSLHVTPLPFLEGHANALRRAEAEQVIAAIADVLDERVEIASSSASPLWLRQLVALWHAERAIVITFNYDTLLERAINESLLSGTQGDDFGLSYADDVVYPAPQAPPAISYADMSAPSGSSLQLLKLHGSLNWFWSTGDTSGATLTRTRERSMFSGASMVDESIDFTGARALDRFLIPPVSSKTDYYNPWLTQALWRTAYRAIQKATEVTLIGYSMPSTDRSSLELLRGISRDATLSVIDRSLGDAKDPSSLLWRASKVAGNLGRIDEGPDAVGDFAADHLRAAAHDLVSSEPIAGAEESTASVLVASSIGWGLNARPKVFTLVSKGAIAQTRDINEAEIRNSPMPPIEMSLNMLPAKMHELSDFYTAGRLRTRLLERDLLTIDRDQRRFSAVSAESVQIGPWATILLYLAPLE